MNRLLIILTVALQYASALQLTRRALPGAAAAATAIGTQNALAAAKPVLVLGANGGTGLECVKYLQKKGRPCVAATRTGEFVGDASKLVTVAKGTSRMCLHAIGAATAAPLTARPLLSTSLASCRHAASQRRASVLP